MLWSVFKRSGDAGSREENASKVKASVLIQSEPKMLKGVSLLINCAGGRLLSRALRDSSRTSREVRKVPTAEVGSSVEERMTQHDASDRNLPLRQFNRTQCPLRTRVLIGSSRA